MECLLGKRWVLGEVVESAGDNGWGCQGEYQWEGVCGGLGWMTALVGGQGGQWGGSCFWDLTDKPCNNGQLFYGLQ